MSSLSFEYFSDLRAPPPLFLWLLNYFVVAIECNESQDCSKEGLKDERQCCADKKQKGRRFIFILNNLANWKSAFLCRAQCSKLIKCGRASSCLS
jgi:hypothetical protein